MPEEQEGKFEPEHIEGMHIEVKDHLEKPNEDECGYCGQLFGPDEIVIEREIHGRKWRFCSEECYRDFLDAADFKDEDLDSKDVAEPVHELDDDMEGDEDNGEEDEF
jgi:hypothetical protein